MAGGGGNLGAASSGSMQNAFAGSNQLMGQFAMAPPTPYAPPIAAGMPTYMNPYIDQVIGRTGQDIARQTAQQLNAVGGEAAMSGAFGGSRHGLVESEVMSEAQRNIGDISAQLRAQGFDTAAGLSAQDIANMQQAQALGQGQQANYMQAINQAAGLGQQGYELAQSAVADQAAAGQQQRSIQDALMRSTAGMFDARTGQPAASAQLVLSALSQNPLANTGTRTTTTSGGGGKGALGSALGLIPALL